MKQATLKDAPSVLNINDRAMWVLGFNAALEKLAVPHLSLCASQDDTMRGYPVCDCGADHENATRAHGVLVPDGKTFCDPSPMGTVEGKR